MKQNSARKELQTEREFDEWKYPTSFAQRALLTNWTGSTGPVITSDACGVHQWILRRDFFRRGRPSHYVEVVRNRSDAYKFLV